MESIVAVETRPERTDQRDHRDTNFDDIQNLTRNIHEQPEVMCPYF